jgi:hypothetical protein
MQMELYAPPGYSAYIETAHARRDTMNIAKHMEAVFVAAIAFAGSASYLVEAQARVPAPLASSIATPTRMAVVTVSARRMSTAEKQASLQAAQHAPADRT